jgi:hypothetical protein
MDVVQVYGLIEQPKANRQVPGIPQIEPVEIKLLSRDSMQSSFFSVSVIQCFQHASS